MIRRPGAQQPNQHIGTEIASKEYNPANPIVKEIENGTQEEQWKGIGEQVYIITMDHRCRDNSNQAFQSTGLNSQKPKIKTVEEFNAKR